MRLPAKYHAFNANNAGGQKIGFQMRTSKECREWGIENFAKLATMILESYATATIFLSGTLSEREYCNSIYSFIPKDLHKRIHNHCGKYSLDELPYFLKASIVLLQAIQVLCICAVRLGFQVLRYF